jgi:two-component system, OmpR family, sensor kinase
MLHRLSLRSRLVLGVLLLATIGLVAADIATYTSLRSFLFDRTDASLEAAHHEAEVELLGARPSASDDGGAPTPSDAVSTPRSRLQDLTRSLPGLFIETRDSAGKVTFSDQVPEFAETGTPPSRPRLPKTISLEPPSGSSPDRVRYLTVSSIEGDLRYRVRTSLDPGSTSMLVLATSLSGVDGTLHRLELIELLVTGAVLIAIAVLGLWAVRLGLRPLDAIGKTAAGIAAGDLTRRVERAEDRTEIGRLGLALNAMLGQIESAFKARDATEDKLRRFVADASHELRTPLAAVRAYAELFTRGADRRPEDLERAMAGITREAARMTLLVEDLLLLARLDEGRPLERERVELSEVVREAVETARTVDPDREIELDAEQAVVLGDRHRLRQIVDNLLGNTRAHTPADAPVRVSVTRLNGTALVRVQDSGPGMTEDEAGRAFERFYRADPSRSRASGGVGLGLSIVSAVAEAHGGEVSVQSEAGKGSTFEISLPLSTDS